VSPCLLGFFDFPNKVIPLPFSVWTPGSGSEAIRAKAESYPKPHLLLPTPPMVFELVDRKPVGWEFVVSREEIPSPAVLLLLLTRQSQCGVFPGAPLMLNQGSTPFITSLLIVVDIRAGLFPPPS